MHQSAALAAGALAVLAGPALAFDIPVSVDARIRDGIGGCLDMLENGAYSDKPGWETHDPGDDEAYEWNTREVMYWTTPNIGFSLVVEHFPGFALATCQGGLSDIKDTVVIPDLTQPGFVGAKEGEGENVAWSWREDSASPQLFIRASFSSSTGNFRFHVTQISEEQP